MAGRQGAVRRDAGAARGLGPVDGRSPEADPMELDRVIHERVRLGIVSSLAVNGSLTFTDLRDLLGITDGNLIAHARKLEDVGYVTGSKSQDGRGSKTEYRLTPAGRSALRAYLDHMEAIIEATRDPGRD